MYKLLASTFCALIFLAVHSYAQVQVNLKMEKKDFLKGEPVNCTVTLTNRTGGDLVLRGDLQTGQNWLDFLVTHRGGRPLSPFKPQLFRTAKIPFGKSVSKTVNLSRFYDLNTEGTFGISVTVKTGNGESGSAYRSNKVFFNVARGQTTWTQRVGVPGKQNEIREYRLISFTSRDRTRLHIQVADPKIDHVYSSINLGESLLIQKPQALIDGNNVLHCLFMVSPELHLKVSVDYNGKFLGKSYYKRGKASPPRLVSYGNGQVDVAGGVSFDPNEVKEKRSTTRKLSERPQTVFSDY